MAVLNHWELGSVRIIEKTKDWKEVGSSVGVGKGWGLVLCTVIGNRRKNKWRI